jgi:hypothetical protein
VSKVAANRGVTNAFYSIFLPMVLEGICQTNELPFTYVDAYHYFGLPTRIFRIFDLGICWSALNLCTVVALSCPPMRDTAIG